MEKKKDYIKLAKDVIEKYDLASFVDILLEYWEEHPTTLGHGFSHVLKAAVESFEFGQMNDYDKPEDLFVGGLFHDIYRPAEGKGGEEDQTAGADIVKELFVENNIDPELTEKVVNSILSHDEWRGEEDVPQFDLLTSYGDKATHGPELAYSYVWASNNYSRAKNGKPVFTSHLQTLVVFGKYQLRAWEVFAKHHVNGMERAVDAYLHIYSINAANYQNDRDGGKFFDYVESIAEGVRVEEKKYLEIFGRSDVSIKKLMRRFYPEKTIEPKEIRLK